MTCVPGACDQQRAILQMAIKVRGMDASMIADMKVMEANGV